jgi:hypothetical protein
MKKLLLTAAAVAMPVGLVAATGGIASAGAPATDVTNASITCTNVSGSLKFAPALTLAGGNPENTSVKLAVSGCTVSGVAGVTVSAGKGSGVLHSTSNAATGLLGNTAVTGQVAIKWTSNVKLTNKSSTVTVTYFTGGTSTDGYASLDILAGNASVSGDFSGGESGANTTLHAESGQTVAALTTTLAAPKSKGIKSITVVGGNPSQPTPSSLHLG